MKNIVVFRESILGISETFIFKQIRSIKKFKVTLIGLLNIHKLDISTIRHISLESLFHVSLYKIFGKSKKLVALINEQNPSLIHIHMGGDAARFVGIRDRFKVPLLATFHGTDAVTTDDWKKKQHNLYYRKYVKNKSKLINTFDHFIAISYFVKSKMILQGFPENKISVHYIGIDTETFSPVIDAKRESLILFVGRLTQQKGCDYLIRAMESVNANIPSAKLYIIGDGPERTNLEKLSNSLKVNCSFLGAQKEDKIKEMLSRARVFCCPSFSEGLGLVFLEAQAMGVPVVSFDSGGIPEAVINNQTGMLYKEKDIGGLAFGIKRFLTDDVLWKKYSENGVEHVRSNFDIRKQSTLLEELYLKIINEYGA